MRSVRLGNFFLEFGDYFNNDGKMGLSAVTCQGNSLIRTVVNQNDIDRLKAIANEILQDEEDRKKYTIPEGTDRIVDKFRDIWELSAKDGNMWTKFSGGNIHRATYKTLVDNYSPLRHMKYLD